MSNNGQRSVKVSFDPAFLGMIDRWLAGREYHQAIGYMVMWGLDDNGQAGEKYKNVHLHGDHEGNIIAQYTNSQGVMTYSIFGQFDPHTDRKYTFHS